MRVESQGFGKFSSICVLLNITSTKTILNKRVIDIMTFLAFSLILLLIFEHAQPPSLNLNHNAYSIFLRIHVRRESMARGT